MNLRPRDRIALSVVVFLGLVAAYYMLALKPEQHKATALDAAIATQQHTLVTEQQAYATGRQAKASLKADAAEWAALRLAVPSQSDIPALLRTLQKTAASAHVTMHSITVSGVSGPATPAAAAAAASTSAASTTGASTTGASASAASAASTVPLQLTFAGGYTELNNLVRRLDSLVVVAGGKVHATGPLLSISNVALTGAPKLSVAITATIYQLAAAPTAGTTTGGTP